LIHSFFGKSGDERNMSFPAMLMSAIAVSHAAKECAQHDAVMLQAQTTKQRLSGGTNSSVKIRAGVRTGDFVDTAGCYTLMVEASQGVSSKCTRVWTADDGVSVCKNMEGGDDDARLAECRALCDSVENCDAITFTPTGSSGSKTSSGVGRCCPSQCGAVHSPDDLQLTHKWKGWDVYTRNSACYVQVVEASRGVASDCTRVWRADDGDAVCKNMEGADDDARLSACKELCDSVENCDAITFTPTGSSGSKTSSGVGRCCPSQCGAVASEDDMKLVDRYKGWDVYLKV